MSDNVPLKSSETFAMHDAWCTFLVIFGLFDPHRLKTRHGGEDCATKPRTMLSVGWSIDIRLQVGRCQRLNFLLHASLHSLEHRAAARKHDASEQVLPDVLLALDDRVVRVLMDTVLIIFGTLAVPIGWLEEDLGAL